MEKQRNHLYGKDCHGGPTLHPTPLNQGFFSSIYPVFILLFLYLSQFYPFSPIFSLFWIILIHTQTCYSISHLSKMFSWSYTTSVSFFCFPLQWNSKMLFILSPLPHIQVSFEPSLRRIFYQMHLIKVTSDFILQIQCSVLYPDLH